MRSNLGAGRLRTSRNTNPQELNNVCHANQECLQPLWTVADLEQGGVGGAPSADATLCYCTLHMSNSSVMFLDIVGQKITPLALRLVA